MRLGWLLAATSGLLLSAEQAGAVDLKTAGYWKAYYAEKNQICGMESHGTMLHGYGAMHIKFVAGQPGLLVQIFKSSWTLPDGIEIPIIIDVDGEPTYEVKANGFGPSANLVSSRVEWLVKTEDSIPFIKRFATARSMIVRFQKGNEAPWMVNLTGSGTISLVMLRCIAAFGKPPTQPYGAPQASKPTQPYGAPSTLTQPYDVTPPTQKQPEPSPPIAKKRKVPAAPSIKDDGSI